METTRSDSEVVSLKDICLLSVSRHLPRFNAAFATTEGTELRRNLRLLQRLHSPYLIDKELDSKGQLDEAYWNFLINEHLEELNVGICAAGNRDALLARIAEVGHALKEIIFDPVHCLSENASIDNGYDYEDFPEHLTFEMDFVNKLLSHFPNARKLMLSSYCNDETLEIISKSCPELKELYFHTHLVTDNGLKSLCCRDEMDGVEVKGLSLKVISLSYREHVKEGIAFLLQNMPSLEIIDCQIFCIPGFDLPGFLYRMNKDEASNALRRKYNLTRLDVNSCNGEEGPDLTEMLTLLADTCPRVKELSSPVSNQEQLDIISRFTELQDLTIRGDQSEADVHPAFCFDSFLKSRGGMVRRLEVHCLKLSADILAQNCPKLETLILRRVNFVALHSNNAVESLTGLREIKVGRLKLETDLHVMYEIPWQSRLDTSLTKQSIIHILNSSPNLEALTFWNCTFWPYKEFAAEFLKFCESSALQVLEIFHCDIKIALLKSAILNCSNLKTLVVDDCDYITPSVFDELDKVAHPQHHVNIKYTSYKPDYLYSSSDDTDDLYG